MSGEKDQDHQKTKIIFGRDEINDLFIKSVNESIGNWSLIGSSEGPSLFYYMVDLKKAYLKALKRGVKLRAITVVTKDNIFYVKDALQYFSEIRHLDGIAGTFVVSDTQYFGTSMMLYNEGKIKKEEGVCKSQYPVELCILSNLRELVHEQQKYFDILWNQAMPGVEKIKEIEMIETPQLKVLNNPFEIQNMLINLLQSVRKEVWLLIYSITIFENIQRFSNILTVLQSLQEKMSVMILVLTTNNDPKKPSEQIQIDTSKDNVPLGKRNIEIRKIENTRLTNYECTTEYHDCHM